MCDRVLSALHLQQGKYWDGKAAVTLPADGSMKEIGFYSPPYPELEDLGATNPRIQRLAAKVRLDTHGRRGGGGGG